MNHVPTIRIRAANDSPAVANAKYVLYWMISARRTGWNFGLQRAVEWAQELKLPLIVFEPLRVDYPWASDRLHCFVLDGMRENAKALRSTSALYYPYVEPSQGAGQKLLETLAEQAGVVVTDEFPGFFLPKMIAAVAPRLKVRLETVDSNGLLPLRAADRVFATAYAFRRHLQQVLPEHLRHFPVAKPLSGARIPKATRLPPAIAKRWPPASAELLDVQTAAVRKLPIDHTVAAAAMAGGQGASERLLSRFVEDRLDEYANDRDAPDLDATSGFSPYLHFGHLSTHQILHRIFSHGGWSPDQLTKKATGRRAGWWGLSESIEAFLDQLITWRELGYNFASQREDHDQYDSLPDWAQRTLAKHARDRRDPLYELEQFERAATHDPLWNAAQRQLVQEGRMHNYLRMLWGKKILEWSTSPQEALAIMIELNNKYALDGRDPNSYSGIFWTLGRYDRPWGPERPIFGTVRYMSSERTARKVAVRNYLKQFER